MSRLLSARTLQPEQQEELVLALLPPYRRRAVRHPVRMQRGQRAGCRQHTAWHGSRIHSPPAVPPCRAPCPQALEFAVELALPALVLALGCFFSISTLVLLF